MTRPSADGSPQVDVPRLAEGVDLIGEFKGSGFKDPPYLVRRRDGQVIQLSRLLFTLAAAADGRSDATAIAHRVSTEVGRGVSADNVRYLVEHKLQPLGVVAPSTEGPPPVLARSRPLLGLTVRGAVVPERVVGAITGVLRPLYLPPVVVAVLATLVAIDAWLFSSSGLARTQVGMRQLLFQPGLLLAMLGLVLVAAAFHECGHATACRYGGGRPGAMGAGMYLAWPAFYTNVTDSYRLGRAGRLRTDLGGIYFNAVFMVGLGGAYAATGYEPLLVLIVVQHLEVVHQLLPFLRLDGYWMVSDLTGVPDLFPRMRPILVSLVPGRPTDPRVAELKPWVRVAVGAWVLVSLPVLALSLGMLVFNLPQITNDLGGSVSLHVRQGLGALGQGVVVQGALSLVQAALAALVLVGLSLTVARVLFRLGSSLYRSSAGHPRLQAGLSLAGAAGVAGALVLWWPSGGPQPPTRALEAGAGGRPAEAPTPVPPANGSGRPATAPPPRTPTASSPPGPASGPAAGPPPPQPPPTAGPEPTAVAAPPPPAEGGAPPPGAVLPSPPPLPLATAAAVPPALSSVAGPSPTPTVGEESAPPTSTTTTTRPTSTTSAATTTTTTSTTTTTTAPPTSTTGGTTTTTQADSTTKTASAAGGNETQESGSGRERGKQSDGRQSDGRQSDGKRSDGKRSDGEGRDGKKNRDRDNGERKGGKKG